jgi:hypothetical protein
MQVCVEQQAGTDVKTLAATAPPTIKHKRLAALSLARQQLGNPSTVQGCGHDAATKGSMIHVQGA